jgi:hypothetical protein
VLVVLSVVGFLGMAPPALADQGCEAPPGTAAVDQYCDNLPAAGGTTDPGQRGLRRLAHVLPKPAVQRLQHSGVVGEALLALPVDVPVGGHLPTATAHRTRFEPGSAALQPGPAASTHSVLASVGPAASEFGGGLGWALVATLFSLAMLSLWGALRRE